MKKLFAVIIPGLLCAGTLLTIFTVPPASASGTQTRWVGDIGGGQRTVSGGPPNTTVQYNFVESTPGLIVYSASSSGPFTNALTLNITLNGAGSGSASYFSKAVQPGQTTETICSPQLGCAPDSPTLFNVYTPASGVSKFQYLKNNLYVDVPNPLTVLKGDTVTLKAIPSPAGSRFYFTSNGPVDPSWSGSSGATGVSETVTLTFNTASTNNHDYKTAIASIVNGGSSTANVLVVNGVQSVTIDKIDPATIFEDNPNIGGGKRVFPDKNDPSDTVDRKRIRVTALTSLGSKKTIYFKSFDLDDPSSDTAPIDANGSAGVDNRGGQGTPAQMGLLSAVGGNGTTNSASAKTDDNGNAALDLTVTMQQGDDFMVAASDDLTYLNGLTVNQILLQDSSGNIVGSGTPKAKTSAMLTVWRRIHLETDSMIAVPTTGAQKNSVTGKITSINGTSNTATLVFTDQNLNDGSKKLDDAPPYTGNGRFENGTISIGTPGNVTATAGLLGNGTNYVEKDDGNGISIPCTVSQSQESDVSGNVISLIGNVFKIAVTGGTLTTNYVGGTIRLGGLNMTINAINVADNSITVDTLADIPVTLVDDDASVLPHMPDTSLVGDKFGLAYVSPVVDGGGNSANNKNNVSFTLNLQSDTTALVDAALNAPNALESDANRADDFWVAYVLTAYQGGPYSTVNQRGDNDPQAEDALGGVTSGTGLGSIVFIEELRDEELEIASTETGATVAHEIAHQFFLEDCPGSHQCDSTIHDMMGSDFYQPDSRFSDADLNRLRSRTKSPGR